MRTTLDLDDGLVEALTSRHPGLSRTEAIEREVPVRPNYVGKSIPSSEKDRVRVKLRELDQEERDQVVMYSVINPSEEGFQPSSDAVATATK